jgi:hypothetical protein
MARLLLNVGQPEEALRGAEIALAAQNKALGPKHVWTTAAARVTAAALDALDRRADATSVRAQYGLDADAPQDGA